MEDHLFVFLEWGIAVVIHYVRRIVIVEPNNVFSRRCMILVEFNLDSFVGCSSSILGVRHLPWLPVADTSWTCW